MQYRRNDINLVRGTFRVRGDTLEFVGVDEELVHRIQFFGDTIESIDVVNMLTGEYVEAKRDLTIFPAKHFITPEEKLRRAVDSIEAELVERLAYFRENGKLLEAQRLETRTRYDLDMLREVGYCNGIENYSRHLTGREAGSTPWCLLDFFPEDWLLFVDESHVTIPQVHGMYGGDRSRKEQLVEHGFRLPSALDNRPLTFEEFEKHTNQAVYVSATPSPYELAQFDAGRRDDHSSDRPGRSRSRSAADAPSGRRLDGRDPLRADRNERVLVTTLTKKMAEDLTDFLLEMGIRVRYLHSEIETLERIAILRDLRKGVFDVLVGINLLREGLDLPEVSLVGILDADKEGYLRSGTSLIQTIGRAARNVDGKVIMYADSSPSRWRARSARPSAAATARSPSTWSTESSRARSANRSATSSTSLARPTRAPWRRCGPRSCRATSPSPWPTTSKSRCAWPRPTSSSRRPPRCATSCSSCAGRPVETKSALPGEGTEGVP